MGQKDLSPRVEKMSGDDNEVDEGREREPG